MPTGYIHGHVAYGAGGAAPGVALPFLPLIDNELRPYDGAQSGKLLGIMASHDNPDAANSIDFDIPQLPAFQEQRIIPLADNDDDALAGALDGGIFPLNGLQLQNGYNLQPAGISAGGDIFAFVLHVGYGNPIGYQPGVIIRRLVAVAIGAAPNVWVPGAAIQDLDPNAVYGVRGMQVLPGSPLDVIAARLVMAETACRPAVAVGAEVDFVKTYGTYAAVLSGRSNPFFEVLSATGGVAHTATCILVLEQISGQTVVAPTGQQVAPGQGSLGGRINLASAGRFNGGNAISNTLTRFMR